MKIIIDREWYSKEKCKVNSKWLYIFGDNRERVGCGGQAIIRYEPNSYGIATKIDPGTYFTDESLRYNKLTINRDIKYLIKEAKKYEAIVFPYMGLGTGLSQMQVKCPQTFLYLCDRLLHYFKFNNLQSLKN